MNLIESLQKVKEASRKLVLLNEEQVTAVLISLAEKLIARASDILKANAEDLAEIPKDDHIYDRIFLNEERIIAINESVREIAAYDSPIGELLEEKTLANGLNLKKVRGPLGVVGAIFEARPNVLIDTFALCFKSRNACVMKGGSQCERTNMILFELVREALGDLATAAHLLSNDREDTAEFLKQSSLVDVIIPRGGQGLIDFVRENSLIPMIETGRGVCHTYFDREGDLAMGKAIIANAKLSRPSVCNALDTLIIHEARLSDLQELCAGLEGVTIYADADAINHLEDAELAKEENFGQEYLSLKMSVKTVASLDEAIEHINKFGSGHSEAIVTEDEDAARKFLQAVDAACVYVNTSTRFTDGGVFGLGAEVGISTQKLHARGPMGIKELTSYKWEVVGNGQVR